MNKFEEYENLINTVKKRAYNSLKHFFELLDIDVNLIDKLTCIPILIDEDKTFDECACYFPGSDKFDPYILVNMNYLDDMLHYINSGKKQGALKDATITIIHELLHANRDIIIKEGITNEIVETGEIEEKYIKKLNIDKYVQILDKLILDGTFDLFDKIVPLSVIQVKDEAIVVAYDKVSKLFLFYDKQKYGIDGNITYMNVGLELNSNFEHKVAISVPEIKYEIDGNIHDASEYYHQQHIDGDLHGKNAIIRSRFQIDLEENIIETLATLIYNSRKNKSIDLEAHSRKYNNNGKPVEEALAAVILRRMGIDMIKWFILSCYQEKYDDKLYKTFDNEYNQLLLIFNELRNNTKEYNQQSDKAISDALDIINEKIPK